MKPIRLLLIVAYFSIICALFSGVGSALEQDEARVSLIWSNETFYQGSSVTVEIFFISDCSEELTINYIGLHFDWMASNSFLGFNISDNPVTIASYGGQNFNPIKIVIPEDASVGTHSYYVGINGLQGESSFSWDSPTRTLLIQDSGEEIYNGSAGADSQQDQLLIIVGVVVVVVVAVLIIILMVRRKRKQTAPIDQPIEA